MQPQGKSVIAGDNVDFMVQATGDPLPGYQWRKDGVSISGETSSTLSLTGVQVSADGSYDVVVSNIAGSVASEVAVLSVAPPVLNVAPQITVQPQRKSVTSGDNVDFLVQATGDPLPGYQWRKDGVSISGETSSTLSLTGVQVSSGGSYDVVVSNIAGSVTSDVAVLVVIPNYLAFAVSGSMSNNRIAFTATRLADGRVLVTGGYDNNGELDTAEIFDPTANAGFGNFSILTAKMSATRYRHTATLLKNGKVLITGGRDADYYSRNTAELFDPAANGGLGGFQALTSTMTVARAGHTATVLADGRVLLLGGSSGNIENTAEIFDPAGNGGFGSFTATGSLTEVRINHTMTSLVDGRVLVTGGDQGGDLDGAEIFDPAGNAGVGSFSTTGFMNQGRYFHHAVLLNDGRVLITGGSEGSGPMKAAEIFDPSANSGVGAFVLVSPMGAGRAGHSMTCLEDGRCLVAGGGEGSNLITTEWFDPTANGSAGGFTTGPTMNHRRFDHEAVFLKDKRILILGGGFAEAEILQ